MWEVLLPFLIPWGGGIPVGVLKARDLGFVWPVMLFLYVISDIVLAIVFEPILLFFVSASRRSLKMKRVKESFKKGIQKTAPQFGTEAGPLALMAIAFGADPMTGRVATRFAGHGFLTGWVLSILGDSLYFLILMISTLCLDGVLGDGTMTTTIILVGMFVVPMLVRKVRGVKA
jgi:hypothetical protein